MEKYTYQSLVDALQDLRKRGFEHDFALQKEAIYCEDLNLHLRPERFQIVEFYRFEGMSNPSDSSVVYAIESDSGLRGVIVDAYGAYSEALSPELLKRLTIDR